MRKPSTAPLSEVLGVQVLLVVQWPAGANNSIRFWVFQKERLSQQRRSYARLAHTYTPCPPPRPSHHSDSIFINSNYDSNLADFHRVHTGTTHPNRGPWTGGIIRKGICSNNRPPDPPNFNVGKFPRLLDFFMTALLTTNLEVGGPGGRLFEKILSGLFLPSMDSIFTVFHF